MTLDPAAASRYAQAFVALAHRQGSLEGCVRDLAAIHDLFEHQPMIQRLLANPEIAVEEKRALLDRVLQSRVAPLALRLAHLLLWKGRLPLLPRIVTEARRFMDETQGVTRGVVRSARPVPAPLLKTLREMLERRLGTRLVLTAALDPALIGGVTVQLRSTVFDGSVRRTLETLREWLLTKGMAHGAAS